MNRSSSKLEGSRHPIALPLCQWHGGRLHNSVNHSSRKQRNLSRAKKQHVHGFPMHKGYFKQEQCNLFRREEYAVPIKYVGFHNYNCSQDWKGVLPPHNARLCSRQRLSAVGCLPTLPPIRSHCRSPSPTSVLTPRTLPPNKGHNSETKIMYVHFL